MRTGHTPETGKLVCQLANVKLMKEKKNEWRNIDVLAGSEI
jgi:hypothetical protein